MTQIKESTNPEQCLKAMGLDLPEPPTAVGAYEPWQRIGNTITTSFQLPWRGETLAYTGLVGHNVDTDQAIEAARICTLNGLAQLCQAADGDLSRVRIVRIDGHIGCTSEFTDIPRVLNGASDLINAVMGEKGRHARTALGHQVMPLNVPVMLGFLAEILDTNDK